MWLLLISEFVFSFKTTKNLRKNINFLNYFDKVATLKIKFVIVTVQWLPFDFTGKCRDFKDAISFVVFIN